MNVTLGQSVAPKWPAADNTSTTGSDGTLNTGSGEIGTNDTSLDLMVGGVREVPGYAQGIIIVMYSAIVIVSVGGNSLVIISIVACQRMKTVTNYFLLNLACADMLTAVICVPFTVIANLLMLYWPFGAVMCPLVTYAQVVAVFLTAFTLVAISLDRFRAVIFPLRPRMTVRQAYIIISQIWLLALAVPLPVAILSRQVIDFDQHGASREYCRELWDDESQRYIYTTVIMVLQYFLPLSVLSGTYITIGLITWVKKPPGEAENNRDRRLAASKRKMVKMMVTVVVIYALCWLPLHSITLIGDAHPDIWTFKHIQAIWNACHWLAMSNCCYNPIVYCWMNAKFRHGFQFALRWCPCIGPPPIPIGGGAVSAYTAAAGPAGCQTAMTIYSRRISSQEMTVGDGRKYSCVNSFGRQSIPYSARFKPISHLPTLA